MHAMNALLQIDDFTEMLEACALDTELFSHTFFPKTVRQASPGFHLEIDRALDDPNNRLVGIEVFRGGAKTTKCRVFAAKRISYALSRTILYIGKSEGHAARSVAWIKKQVEFNAAWAQTYGLKKGSVWTGSDIEILHGVEEISIRILGVGITGSIRGINFDDYRPDLIILDDVQDEENSATPEQRQKIEDLIYGALKESLAPESECPDAKMVGLQTPLDREDYISQAEADAEWTFLRFGCFTKETETLPLHLQESAWPERWSSDTLRKQKAAAIARNHASIWYREKECRLISRETSDFDEEWIQYWDVIPDRMATILVIDPVPPPTDKQVQQGMSKRDFEVLNVLGLFRGKVFDLEYAMNRGHDPDWTVAEFFRLVYKWKIPRAVVISVNYEKTLAWLLRKAMKQRRKYIQIDDHTFEGKADRRSKRDRIVQGLNGVMSNKQFYLHKSMVDLIDQIRSYPAVSHDDVIETAAVGAEKLLEADFIEGELEDEEDIPSLGDWRSAP